MTPDIETILVAHLRADAAVAAITDRIGTRHPRSTTDPWVKIYLLDDRVHVRSSALHFIHAAVQLDCYGSSDQVLAESEASDLGRAVRAALHGMAAGDHVDAVVTGVSDLALRPLPDDSLEPARERYIVTATIHAHS